MLDRKNSISDKISEKIKMFSGIYNENKEQKNEIIPVSSRENFEISEADYEMRGPGDVMGTMQSGTAASDVLMLSRYTDILEAAIEDAEIIMKDRVKGTNLTDTEYAYNMMVRSGASDNSNII